MISINQSNVLYLIAITLLLTILLIKTKMKIFLLFLPIVIGYNNYYLINNSDVLICGNKSENTSNFNWFVGENSLFKTYLNLQKTYQYNVRLYISVNMIYLIQI